MDVRISGLRLRHAAPTFMQDYTVPSGGDYAVHRGGTVHLNGTANCTVDHTFFDAVGGNAVWLTDYNRNASIAVRGTIYHPACVALKQGLWYGGGGNAGPTVAHGLIASPPSLPPHSGAVQQQNPPLLFMFMLTCAGNSK